MQRTSKWLTDKISIAFVGIPFILPGYCPEIQFFSPALTLWKRQGINTICFKKYLLRGANTLIIKPSRGLNRGDWSVVFCSLLVTTLKKKPLLPEVPSKNELNLFNLS